MEFDYFLQLVADNLPRDLYFYSYFSDYLKDTNLVKLDEFSDHLVMTLP